MSARRRRATSLAKLTAASPDTTILVDEAYFDYVTDPDHETHVPIAVENKNVIVARTFSKAYGMAGLRQGYAIAHADTITQDAAVGGRRAAPGRSTCSAWRPAIAAIQQDASFTANERNRNKAVRDFSMKWFADRGMKPTDCQANFMFVNIGTPAKAFREACRAKGVMVARDFPPFEKTHGPHHPRHDGRNAEGRDGVRRSARPRSRRPRRSGRKTNVKRRTRRTRRKVVSASSAGSAF